MPRTPAEPVLIDISRPLGPRTPVFPGDQPFERRVTCARGEGRPYESSCLVLSAHAGTHLDAPSHFLAGGASLDRLPLASFVLPARVVEAGGPVVTPADLAGLPPRPGRALLFRTRKPPGAAGRPDRGWLESAAARRCLELGAPLVGIDQLSVDRPGDEDFPVHHLLLGAGCLILEGLDLAAAPAGDYGLVCLPLGIAGGEASPVRAVLVPPGEHGRPVLTFNPAHPPSKETP